MTSRLLPLILLPSLLQANHAFDHYLRALDLIQEGRTAEARAELRTAIRTSTDNPAQLWIELGDLDAAEGRNLSALSNYRRATAADPSLLAARYKEAEALANLGRPAEAEAVWSDIARKHPDQTQALAFKAFSLQGRGEPEQALKTWRELLRHDPSNPDAVLNTVELLLETGQCTEAADLLETIPTTALPDFNPLLRTADCLRRTGRMERSLRLLDRPWHDIESIPARPTLLKAKADILFLSGRDQEALAAIREYESTSTEELPHGLHAVRSAITGTDLTDSLAKARSLAELPHQHLAATFAIPRILLHLGRTNEAYDSLLSCAQTAWELGDLPLALSTLETARHLSRPDHDPTGHHILRYAVLNAAGQPRQARQALREALATRPSTCEGQARKTTFLLAAGRNKEAREEALLWLRCSRSNADSLLTLALAAVNLGRTDEALSWTLLALRQHPHLPEANAFAGQSLLALRRPDEALPYLENARRAKPDNHTVLFFLAQALDLLDRDHEALQAMEEAVRLSPETAEYLNYLGYLMADLNTDPVRAETLVRKALEQDPENPYYLDSLGWALFRQGRLPEAHDILRTAVRIMEARRTPEADIYDHLGDVLAALGDLHGAKTFWRKALRLNPNDRRLRAKLR